MYKLVYLHLSLKNKLHACNISRSLYDYFSEGSPELNPSNVYTSLLNLQYKIKYRINQSGRQNTLNSPIESKHDKDTSRLWILN